MAFLKQTPQTLFTLGGKFNVRFLPEGHIEKAINLYSRSYYEDLIVSEGFDKHCGVKQQDWIDHFDKAVRHKQAVKQVFEVVDANDDSKPAALYMYSPHMPLKNKGISPKFDGLCQFETEGYAIVKKSIPNFYEYAYLGSATLDRDFRGMGIYESTCAAICKYLSEQDNFKGLYSQFVLPKVVRNLVQKYGAEILGKVYYDEFEVNGKKILNYIQQDKYHNGDRASSFVIKMDYNDILRHTTFDDLISASHSGHKNPAQAQKM